MIVTGLGASSRPCRLAVRSQEKIVSRHIVLNIAFWISEDGRTCPTHDQVLQEINGPCQSVHGVELIRDPNPSTNVPWSALLSIRLPFFTSIMKLTHDPCRTSVVCTQHVPNLCPMPCLRHSSESVRMFSINDCTHIRGQSLHTAARLGGVSANIHGGECELRGDSLVWTMACKHPSLGRRV